MSDPLTPYGNRPMVTPIVNAVNFEYRGNTACRRSATHLEAGPGVEANRHRFAAT